MGEVAGATDQMFRGVVDALRESLPTVGGRMPRGDVDRQQVL
jgi:hypothetical protein